MAYVPNSGSVVAFQSQPSSLLAGVSVIGLTPVSVSNLPTNQNVSGSVVSFQGTNPWVIIGSVQGSFSPPANQSVSGAVSVSNFPANQSVSGSVGITGTPAVSVQGTVFVSGSVVTVGTAVSNQSVSGTVGSSIIGNVPVVVQGSVATVIIGGSIAASFTPPANQSVSGTVGASIIGLPPVRVSDGTNTANLLPNSGGSNSSILQGALLTAGAFTETTYTATSVLSTTPTDVSNYKWISVQQTSTGGSSTTTFQGSNDNVNWVGVTLQRIDQTIAAPATTAAGNNSIYVGPISFRWFRLNITGIASGTTAGVIEFFTNPTISLSPGGQVALNGTSAVAVGGSVITIFNTPSIVGTYAEDSASANNDKGILSLGLRNDTVSSVVNADLDYTVFAADSAGRHLIKPFSADESRLDTATSVVSSSVTSLFPSVVGLRNYVTDIMIANTGSVATLVTFKDGSTSILGFTIAPAGGGSNINGMAFPLRTAPAQDFTFTATTPSSVLYVTAKGYKAP